MKKLLNIIILLAIVLNIFGQSKIKKDIVEAEEQLIIQDVDFVDWLDDSTGAVLINGSNGLSKNGNDIEWGNSTLDTTTTIAGGGNILNLGTATSKLSALNSNVSGNISIVSDALIGLGAEGKSWIISGDYIVNFSNSDTLCTLAVLEAAIEAAQPVLPFNYDYNFSSSITDARPGIGYFKFNNATLANVTEIYIDYFDANSVAKNDWLSLSDTGSFITVQTDVSNYAIYQLTDALIDATNYFKYNVTYSSHSGVISGSNTIDIELNNTTGSGGGGTATSEHAYFDTISSHNNSFVYFDSTVVIEDTLKTPLIYNETNVDINTETFTVTSTDITLTAEDIVLQATDETIFLISGSDILRLTNDTLFADGTSPSTEITAKFAGVSVGGGEVIDTTYSPDYVMENTVVDSIQVTKTIRYNTSEGVHEFLTGKDEVVWQGALEDLFQFYNNTGQTITNGTPLYYSGVNGDSILTCDYATANIEFTVLRYAGLATGDVPNANWGFGNVRGKVRDYNTTGLSQVGAVFLGNDSLPTMIKPTYPSQVLILGGVIDVAVNGVLYHDPSFALQRELESRDYSFTTQGILSGIYYKGGYYDWSATDANLTQASTTQAYGVISIAYSAHASVVCGGVGSTDAGVVGLRVTGTSIDDNGVRTAADADTIITDITAVATDEYYESKKWIGIVTYELITISGSPTTYSLDFNYGYAKYEDANNNDYYLVGLEVVGLAGANDTDFNIELLHHKSTGWTYAATGFIAGNGAIASWDTDLAPEDNLSSGSNFAWKRSNLSTFIDGNGSEGGIFRITTGSSAAVQSMDLHILIALD